MNQQDATDQSTNAPPPAIGSDRVIMYAVIDKYVHFTGKQRLFVGGKLLGRVPMIAICRSFQKDIKDYLVIFCSKKWKVLGVTGAKSLLLAKKEVERYYIGVSEKWVTVRTSEKDAKRWMAAKYPDEVCSFCGQMSVEVEAVFPAARAAICSSCVQTFASELKRKSQT
jgi:hypothetical protein